MKQREVFRMDPCYDQFERNLHMRLKLADAIQLLGPGDFVCSHTPCKAADAGNVCHLRNEILLNLRRACRTGLENSESSHHTSVSREDRRRPLRAEAVRERDRSNGTRLKEWIRFKIGHDHLSLGKRGYAAGPDFGRNSQTFTGIIEGPWEAGYSSYPELRTTPIDQVNAAVTIG